MKSKFITLITLLILTTIFFNSCNNKLEINGELKETAIVYGLLNQADSVQYLKIYKAFLTEENTLIAASKPENIYYYDSIEVYLEILEPSGNGYLNKGAIQFDTTTLIPKNPGIFSNPYQILYRSKPGQALLNSNYFYKVVIRNKYTGKETTAITNLIQAPSNLNPFAWKSFNPGSPYAPMVNVFSSIAITAPINSSQVEVYFEFNYIEKNIVTGDSVKKGPIIVSIGTTKYLKFDDSFDLNLSGNKFLNGLAKNIPVNPNIVRYDDTCSMIIWAAGAEFIRYNEVNTPSLSIVEERPTYTNVSNGLGLVSCRYYYRYPRVMLNRTSVDSLKKSSITKDLNFYAF